MLVNNNFMEVVMSDLTAREFRIVFYHGWHNDLWNQTNITDLMNRIPADEMKKVPLTVQKIALKLSCIGSC